VREKRSREWRPTRRASVAYFLWRLMLVERVKVSRDTILFLLGVFILVYELTQAHPPSDALITVGGGFAGAPLFLRFDERQVYRRRRGK
jgi:hypothetical protein